MVHCARRFYIGLITKGEARDQRFRRLNERPIEFRFVFDCVTRLRPKTVLDVGSGTTALPALLADCGCVVTASDNVRDYWPHGMVNRHWHVVVDDIRATRLTGPYDMVTCVSVIEHIDDPVAAVRSMVGLLAPGGHLAITTPYNEIRFVPNVYALPGAAYGQDLPYICRSTSRAELGEWLEATGAELVTQEYWQVWTGEVWTQGEPLPVPRQVAADDPHQLTCVLMRKPVG